MKTIKKYLKPFGIIFAYFGISLILQIFYFMLGIESNVIDNVMLVIASSVATGYVVYTFRDAMKSHFGELKKNFKKFMKKAFSNWITGFVLMFVVNAILVTILDGLAPNEEASRETMKMFYFYSIIYTCILAPIAEELLFRINFKDSFKDKRTFIWGTAILFGAMHVIGSISHWTDILYLAPYTILGYYFSKTYVETDNVYPSIIIHMFHNILAILAIVLNI